PFCKGMEVSERLRFLFLPDRSNSASITRMGLGFLCKTGIAYSFLNMALQQIKVAKKERPFLSILQYPYTFCKEQKLSKQCAENIVTLFSNTSFYCRIKWVNF